MNNSTVILHGLAFSGIEPQDVAVQVQIARGMPSFSIVGLANKSVAEAKQRVWSAFASLSISLPYQRITVNLAPADLVKDGSHFDLPIALGLLAILDMVPYEEISEYLIIGELSLDGSIMPVNGVLPAAIAAVSRNKGLICPATNVAEAAWSGNKSILAPCNLTQLMQHFSGEKMMNVTPANLALPAEQYPDLKDIKGQKFAKRALEIAAAGGHNLLMIGPPGSGKSMLARRLPGLLPPMSAEEILEVSVIASIAGILNKEEGLVNKRPYRDPHSSASMPAMVGGGRKGQPGEVTLAHHGILFLDELPEFQREVLESLRQPMESRTISIARVNAHVTYPADFMLVAAMNPCKCGYFGTNHANCTRIPRCAQDYQNRISGPLWDRFDLAIVVPQINLMLAKAEDNTETSEVVRNRVYTARATQRARYSDKAVKLNAHIDGDLLSMAVQLDLSSRELLANYAEKFHLSGRAVHRVMRVARTIADLENQEDVSISHVSEAISYRVRRQAG
ncbi:MAG: YifB family Mg chelatase-like AAA ATPase [Proteobacteria bacterium]|nr:YifB family Mg chelatase-like AAA ATPase [Pseudomonadota bacterium]